ncbi:MAG: hypothetical protein A2498_07330 [Lentisphaerae bacterium RIFOXYC12_FULL_60_16]|nr:MAG: hypothetical protein A2498_07330 [Lentisphaerae bacterium RIFOXYC12_FULL_60_16]OGV85553.1 MAG: hypothetical protein A2340_12670 [Lentisphaerae bacterium RIFOXYB12_FULL_60_10]
MENYFSQGSKVFRTRGGWPLSGARYRVLSEAMQDSRRDRPVLRPVSRMRVKARGKATILVL